MSKYQLIVPLKAGGQRKYTSVSKSSALKRLADHNATVEALGTSELYFTAYIREPDGREVYLTS